MNTDMTKAILDGRKVQTRRVIKLDKYVKPKVTTNEFKEYVCEHCGHLAKTYENEKACLWCLNEWVKTKYQIGETIFVKETWQYYDWFDDKQGFIYKASPELFHWDKDTVKWKSSIHLIKEMARIFLKVTNVRVERLQDITNEERIKEGVNPYITWNHKPHEKKDSIMIGGEFTCIWDETAPKGYKWEDNPYVFVYEFERIEEEVR